MKIKLGFVEQNQFTLRRGKGIRGIRYVKRGLKGDREGRGEGARRGERCNSKRYLQTSGHLISLRSVQWTDMNSKQNFPYKKSRFKKKSKILWPELFIPLIDCSMSAMQWCKGSRKKNLNGIAFMAFLPHPPPPPSRLLRSTAEL